MPFGLSLSTVKLVGIAALAMFIAGLLVTVKIQHSNNMALKAQVQAITAQRDEAIAANKDLSDQVTSLTADKAAALNKAAETEKALQIELGRETTNVATVEKTIEKVAVASDDVCSPALAAALGGVCPAAGSNDHASASH